MTTPATIVLIGYGEVGQTLAADLHASRGDPVSAWDRLFVEPASAPSRALVSGHVRAGRSLPDALRHCSLAISAVTAAECVAAATEAAAALPRGAWYLDLNSVSPSTRLAAAQAIEAAGGRFLEAAVMSPIASKRIASPILLGGPHATEFLPVAHALGFRGAEACSCTLGAASAAKMCRSVMIKGLEALLAESLLSARRYGVEDTVLASLQDLLPLGDWAGIARYMVSRSVQHGRRRAEEMREAAAAVREAGLEPWMSTACVARQEWAAGHLNALAYDALSPLLDAMLAAVPDPRAAAPESTPIAPDAAHPAMPIARGCA